MATVSQGVEPPFIRSIGLQNFQTIGEYQTIPFGRLTFLYGPNSAGKSAVTDALEALAFLWRTSALDENPEDENQFDISNRWTPPVLQRSFRRKGRNRKGEVGYEGVSRLDVTVDVPVAELLLYRGNQGGYVRRLIVSSLNFGRCADARGRVVIRAEMGTSAREFRYYELFVNGESLIRYEGVSAELNLAHPVLKDNEVCLGHPWGLGAATDIAAGWARMICQEENRLIVPMCPYIYRDRTISPDDRDSILENEYRLDTDIDPEQEEPTQPGAPEFGAVMEGVRAFAKVYNAIVTQISPVIEQALSVHRVGASRMIPTREEMTYLLSPHLNSGDSSEDRHRAERRRILALRAEGNLQYEALAGESLVQELRQALASQRRLPKDVRSTLEDWCNHYRSTAVLDAVNAALRDQLPAGRTYQIAGDVRWIMPMTNAIVGISRSDPYDVDALVALELRDEAGNRFNFDEVGSGIGYVLPILVAIAGYRHCLIQQPELHLHPALQGSLSDTFIAACHEGRRLVVESHSEHLLLRALRRVRETGAGKAASPALSLAAEDVCVLYFEPVADGTTRVRHIRVAPDGDLLDRWPGGFFAERDKDLFDE